MTERFRLRFTFWLDMRKADEVALAETIDALKQERNFVSTIRDGIRLIKDLRRGQTQVLQELFPWVVLQATSAEPQLVLPEAVTPKVEEAIDRLDELKQLILQQQAEASLSGTSSSTALHLPSPQAAKRLLEVKLATADKDEKPTWNFMISSALSVYGHCNFLPSEIIEYGVQRGKITPAMLRNKRDRKGAAEQARSRKNAAAAGERQAETSSHTIRQEHGSAKMMDAPQLAPPQYEDEDLGLVVKMPGA